jgi:hypothetical protein
MLEELNGIITKAEAEAFETFFFLVFTPNPIKDTVRIIIDDGTIKTTLRRKKFHSVIETICGLDMANAIDSALSEMGGFFLLDREKRSIRKLMNTSDFEKLHVMDVIEDAHEQYKGTSKMSLYDAVMGDRHIATGSVNVDAVIHGTERKSIGSFIRYDPNKKNRKR